MSLPISPAPMTSTVRPFRSPKIFLRQRGGREADRHRALGERRLGAHPLADGERPREHLVEHRADGALVGRCRVRLLHLPEDLRLADDERVEAGRHAEQVLRRRRPSHLSYRCGSDRGAVERRGSRRGSASRSARAPPHVVARDVDLGAVARREHHRSRGRRARRERRQRVVRGPASRSRGARAVRRAPSGGSRRGGTGACAASTLEVVAAGQEVADRHEVEQHDREADAPTGRRPAFRPSRAGARRARTCRRPSTRTRAEDLRVGERHRLDARIGRSARPAPAPPRSRRPSRRP